MFALSRRVAYAGPVGPVAQGIEQEFPKLCVAGSIPAGVAGLNKPTGTPCPHESLPHRFENLAWCQM